MMATSKRFDELVESWTQAACREWGYAPPGADYYERIARRLPDGLRALIARGVTEGVIGCQGTKFVLNRLPGKGPYAWFSKRSVPHEPSPSWEYFV